MLHTSLDVVVYIEADVEDLYQIIINHLFTYVWMCVEMGDSKKTHHAQNRNNDKIDQ